MTKTATDQKLDDLKETVVQGFERNSEQHKQIFDEQKKTNGNMINHEGRLIELEKQKIELRNWVRWSPYAGMFLIQIITLFLLLRR